MNLVLHQLRLEIKRSRVGLALFLLILAGNFMVTAGMIGGPTINEHGSWTYGGMMPTLLAIAYWVALPLVVANCILADSPARRDRFLTTRPLSSKALFTAKGLYIVVAALLPVALLEVLSAATLEGLSGLSLLAGVERFVFAGTIAFVIAAYAAHWKNIQGFFIATAVGIGLLMVGGRLVAMLIISLMEKERNFFSGEPSILTAMQGLVVLALGLSLTAWVCSRRGRKFRYLIPALVPITAVAFLAASKSPLRTIPFRAGDQPTLDKLLADGEGVTVVPRGFHISRNQELPELSANYNIRPTLSDLPEDLEVRWSIVDHEWMVDGKRAAYTQNNTHALARTFVSTDAVPISWSLAQTIQKHVKETVLFRLGGNRGRSHSSSLSSKSLRYLPESPLVGKDARVRTQLVGDALRWRIAADLPIEVGASDSGGSSRWKIASHKMSGNGISLRVSERMLVLHAAGDPRHRNQGSRWSNLYNFVLYLPAEKAAWFGGPNHQSSAPGVSATKHYYGELQFQSYGSRSKFSRASLKDARLLILEPELVGRVSHQWESPKFALRSKPSHQGNRSSDYEDHEKLSAAEFALWFKRFEKISPDVEPSVFRNHLELILSQIDRVDRRLSNQREPAVIYAANFVPKHLPTILDLLPGLAFGQRDFLLEVIKQGALDQQRHLVINAIPEEDDLIVVSQVRGWEQDARETYISMVRDYRNTGSRFLFPLLAQNDPALDALVLDSYRTNPQTDVYETLRSIPRLAERTEKITDTFWKPGRIVLERKEPRGMIQFALLQGKQEALDELFTTLKIVGMVKGGSNYALGSLISNSFQIPESVAKDRGNVHDKHLAWIMQYDPNDFTFDPVFRRFVLKVATKTI